MRECCALGDEDSVSHENLLTALVAGLPAKKQVKALRRMGQEAPSELPALGPAVPQETGHIWHGRMVSHARCALATTHSNLTNTGSQYQKSITLAL